MANGTALEAGKGGSDAGWQLHRAFDGYISNAYRFRTARDSGYTFTDQDLSQEVSFTFMLQDTDLLEFHFVASANEDLNADIDRISYFPLEDITDAQTRWWMYTVEEAHLQLNYLFPFLPQLRAGRQTSDRISAALFDGAAIELAWGYGILVALYGGIAVHPYEVVAAWGSDYLAGAAIQFSPFAGTTVSLDYLFTRDERDPYLGKGQMDHLIVTELGQRLFEFLTIFSSFSLLNFRIDDLKLSTHGSFPEIALEVFFRYWLQLQEYDELSEELAEYHDIIGQPAPHHYFEIGVRKLIGEHVGLHAGYEQQFLLKAEQQDTFNHRSGRISSGVELIDLLIEGLSLGLSGRLWFAGQTRRFSTGLDLGYRPRRTNGPLINAGVNIETSKYQDYLDRGLSTGGQTVYLEGSIPVKWGVSVRASYRFEHSLENYHCVRAEITYAF